MRVECKACGIAFHATPVDPTGFSKEKVLCWYCWKEREAVKKAVKEYKDTK